MNGEDYDFFLGDLVINIPSSHDTELPDNGMRDPLADSQEEETMSKDFDDSHRVPRDPLADSEENIRLKLEEDTSEDDGELPNGDLIDNSFGDSLVGSEDVTNLKQEPPVTGDKVDSKSDYTEGDGKEAKESEFQCTNCPKSFRRKASLLNHVKCHHHRPKRQCTMRRRFSCDKCDLKYFNKANLIKHLSKKHSTQTSGPSLDTGSSSGEKKPRISSKCDNVDSKSDYTEGDEKEAKEFVTGNSSGKEKPRISSKCDNGDSKSDYTKGDKKEAKESEFQCTNCPKSFRHRASLMMHIKCHNNPKRECMMRRRFSCDKCDLKYFYKADLIKHLSKKHSTQTSGPSLDTGSSSDEKLNSDAIENLKPSYSVRLKRIASVLNFKCNECDMSFHKCNECDKSFHKKSALVNHMKSHLNPTKRWIGRTRRFNCDVCGKSYYYKVDLINHQRACKQMTEEISDLKIF